MQTSAVPVGIAVSTNALPWEWMLKVCHAECFQYHVIPDRLSCRIWYNHVGSTLGQI